MARMKTISFKVSATFLDEIKRHRSIMSAQSNGGLVQLSDAVRDLVTLGLAGRVGPFVARRMVTRSRAEYAAAKGKRAPAKTAPPKGKAILRRVK